MKNIVIGLLTFILFFSIARCDAKEQFEEQVAEKLFEEASGGDLDIHGDKVTIKEVTGEEVTLGDNKWPTSELVKNIPEFKGGIVVAVLERADSIVITLESVQEEDAFSYFQRIKKDFPKNVFEMNAEDTVSFSGNNAIGINVTLVYMSGMLIINVTGSQH
jgi:hypothetical protein